MAFGRKEELLDQRPTALLGAIENEITTPGSETEKETACRWDFVAWHEIIKLSHGKRKKWTENILRREGENMVIRFFDTISFNKILVAPKFKVYTLTTT